MMLPWCIAGRNSIWPVLHDVSILMKRHTSYDLSEISELNELDDYSWANVYLKLGWVLLSIRLRDYGDPEIRDQKTVYCLGWPKSLGDPKHPKKI